MNDNPTPSPAKATIFLVLAILLLVAGLITLIPYAGAPKTSLIGYKSLCTFTPISTIISLLGAQTCYVLWKKNSGRNEGPPKQDGHTP